MNLQCIVLLHQHDQTTVNLPPAVGGLRHLATNILIHLRRGLASKKQNILVRKISQYLEYPRQKCGAWSHGPCKRESNDEYFQHKGHVLSLIRLFYVYEYLMRWTHPRLILAWWTHSYTCFAWSLLYTFDNLDSLHRYHVLYDFFGVNLLCTFMGDVV